MHIIYLSLLCIPIPYQVINNNYLSHFFNIKKRVRQGHALSPTIFVLCIEYLAAMLRQSKNYQGFKIEHHCFKVSLFADVTIIYLDENSFLFRCVFDIFILSANYCIIGK